MNIALVNPPGKRPYLRDYYTASLAKSDYYYPPVDFIWLSASVERPVRVYDAIAGKINPERLIRDIVSFKPSFIFCLISSLSLEEDIGFIKDVRAATGAGIIAMGDVCHNSPYRILEEHPEIDAALKTFSCTNIMNVLKNNLSSAHPVDGWALRSDNASAARGSDDDKERDVKIGMPKWDAFRLKSYRFPFALREPVATVLTDYGCPFHCAYCPLGKLKWRTRSIDEVIGEIDHLAGAGIREIHFRDQTFGVDKGRTIRILRHLRERKFSWSCFSRADIMSEDLLSGMKDSGCHTIIFGIESGDDTFREQYGKAISNDVIGRTLARCARLRINTVGTFIIGLPEEDRDSINRTIEYATTLPLDYVSFNTAMPRMGSELYHADKRESAFMPHEEALRFCALANRRFYLRVPYLWRRLKKVNSLSAMINEARLGYNLIVSPQMKRLLEGRRGAAG